MSQQKPGRRTFLRTATTSAALALGAAACGRPGEILIPSDSEVFDTYTPVPDRVTVQHGHDISGEFARFSIEGREHLLTPDSSQSDIAAAQHNLGMVIEDLYGTQAAKITASESPEIFDHRDEFLKSMQPMRSDWVRDGRVNITDIYFVLFALQANQQLLPDAARDLTFRTLIQTVRATGRHQEYVPVSFGQEGFDKVHGQILNPIMSFKADPSLFYSTTIQGSTNNPDEVELLPAMQYPGHVNQAVGISTPDNQDITVRVRGRDNIQDELRFGVGYYLSVDLGDGKDEPGRNGNVTVRYLDEHVFRHGKMRVHQPSRKCSSIVSLC
jgi:hypothetical protein